VEALASAMTSLGEALGGGRAAGILALVFGTRALLIPILTPLAIRTRDRTRVVRRIRPQIRELDRRLKDHPSELAKRLKALHEANGIKMVDWPGLGGALVQLPILIALFQAVLLVWEPHALGLAATALGVVAAAFAVFGTKVSGQAEGASWMLWLSGIAPVAICVWLGTGVAYYLTAFYAAGALQSLLMRRASTEPPQEQS
jgi:membrane protein insertase Oxa1/YidC/SpoIIIJ